MDNKIAVLIGQGFEDSEYTKPAEAFKRAGYKLVHIGLKKGETVKGKKQDTPVRIDMEAGEAKPDEFIAVFIPGGHSPDNLRAYEEPVRFVAQSMYMDKPVFAICHAPQLLISADKLRNRTITGWKSLIQDIRNAGAQFVDKEVVVDGNIVSSRNPNDIPAFVDACLKKLEEVKAERKAA